MRLVIQRVAHASVTIGGVVRARIDRGLLVLVSIEDADGPEDAGWLAGKVAKLRIFDDHEGVMNLAVNDISGSVLIVSQFTLHALTAKGNRPSYIRASRPEHAVPLYEAFVAEVQKLVPTPVQTGIFGADMAVELLNDGPVTILMDSQHRE